MTRMNILHRHLVGLTLIFIFSAQPIFERASQPINQQH
jgi:hypothetical protein